MFAVRCSILFLILSWIDNDDFYFQRTRVCYLEQDPGWRVRKWMAHVGLHLGVFSFKLCLNLVSVPWWSLLIAELWRSEGRRRENDDVTKQGGHFATIADRSTKESSFSSKRTSLSLNIRVNGQLTPVKTSVQWPYRGLKFRHFGGHLTRYWVSIGSIAGSSQVNLLYLPSLNVDYVGVSRVMEKKVITAVLYKDETFLWSGFSCNRSRHSNVMMPLRFSFILVLLCSRSFLKKSLKGVCTCHNCLSLGKVWTNSIRAFWKYFETKFQESYRQWNSMLL